MACCISVAPPEILVAFPSLLVGLGPTVAQPPPEMGTEFLTLHRCLPGSLVRHRWEAGEGIYGPRDHLERVLLQEG